MTLRTHVMMISPLSLIWELAREDPSPFFQKGITSTCIIYRNLRDCTSYPPLFLGRGVISHPPPPVGLMHGLDVADVARGMIMASLGVRTYVVLPIGTYR